MSKQTALKKALYFFITKIIIGIGVIGASVALIEWLRTSLLDKTSLTDNTKNIITAIVDSVAAVSAYILLFGKYEKRNITELGTTGFVKYAGIGILTGFTLQAFFILIIYIGGTYSIIHINPASALITPFAFALTAGFVAEILIVGVVFRLMEEQMGTIITLIFFIILFTVLHVNTKGANFVSVGATAMQAGFLLPASYVCSRSLWLPIFLHFSWDFSEPGIFGGTNESTSLTQSLFTSKIAGHPLITGGETGPQDSLQSLILCLLTGLIFLFIAKRKNNLIRFKKQPATTA
jgi:membrane protease YdiL (CAAX protease family)